MSQGKEEYRAHYARLAKEFADLPRVVVQLDNGEQGTTLLLGQLQGLDLRQDSGYGVGVMIDKMPDGKEYGYYFYRAENVRLFSEFKDQLMQLVDRGATWDGNLIGKDHRTILQKLGLVSKAEGWNFATEAGVREAVKAGWLRP